MKVRPLMRVTPSRGKFPEGVTLKVAVCGSSERTLQCAQALADDPRFTIDWVVTPSPKPIGRRQAITPNPLDSWAQERLLPVFPVEKSLAPLREALADAAPIDYLLVVDFGYLVPPWLLDRPKIAPINVHPSDLPKYRGSSPGQYALLYGETSSAVCIMRMTAGLDEGPVIARLIFSIQEQETSDSYYRKAFTLAAESLPPTLADYADNRAEMPQPIEPTLPIAKRFSRQDGYISYSLLEAAKNASSVQPAASELSPILQEVLTRQPAVTIAQLIERAVRALSPWPGIWTIADHAGRQNVRQKILAAHLENGKLVIDRWQFEGESAKP